jgi:hypothetical protein
VFDLSVFIPTHYAGPRHYASIMQACDLAKRNENIEVLISDNSGNREKRAFLASFESQNFRVVDGPEVGNFLHALRQTQGRYVMAMGDDDTLLAATIPAFMADLQGNSDFIGASGRVGRELASSYDFHHMTGVDSAGYDDRVSAVVATIPIGNPLFHTIAKRDVMLEAFELWFSIPNMQAYHDHIVTLYLACVGPLKLFEQPYFIYNFGNWTKEERVASELRYATTLGLPVSIVLMQRLMLGIEGYFLIMSRRFTAGDRQRQAAASAWLSAWTGAWYRGLERYYVSPEILGCPSFPEVDRVVQQLKNTGLAPAEVLEATAGLYDALLGNGSDYSKFWASL